MASSGSGHHNGPYFTIALHLHTSRGSFILTLYEKRVSAADLPFFLALMEHLAGRGITCPQPVKDRQGNVTRIERTFSVGK